MIQMNNVIKCSITIGVISFWLYSLIEYTLWKTDHEQTL
jgi:hypothetical protein